MVGDSIKENMEMLHERISRAVQRRGDSSLGVTLVAVSKKQSPEKMRVALEAGQLDFGENYVQEAIEKQRHLPDNRMRWHLIGPLQSNKVPLIGGRFHLIQSVDRMKIARALSDRAIHDRRRQRVLIQINIAGEESKSGFTPEQVRQEWPQLMEFEGLELCGLMVFPPLGPEKQSRGYFRVGAGIFDELRSVMVRASRADTFTTLSMGTSHDFEWAIEEGANMIRVGTVLFGSRDER